MDKIWLSSYEPGVRAEVDVRAYGSIVDVFHNSVQKFGSRPGYTNMGVSQTYAETGAYVDQFASYLQNVLKLPRGERVAVMMPNVLQYPVAVFGILQAGCVVVNVNPLYTPRELAAGCGSQRYPPRPHRSAPAPTPAGTGPAGSRTSGANL